MINGVVLFVTPEFKTTLLNTKVLKKKLEPLFILLALKLNNKLYTPSQLKNLDVLSYKKTVLNFNVSLERKLKMTYRLTNSK